MIANWVAKAKDEAPCGLPKEEIGAFAAKLLEVQAEFVRTLLDLAQADRRWLSHRPYPFEPGE